MFKIRFILQLLCLSTFSLCAASKTSYLPHCLGTLEKSDVVVALKCTRDSGMLTQEHLQIIQNLQKQHGVQFTYLDLSEVSTDRHFLNGLSTILPQLKTLRLAGSLGTLSESFAEKLSNLADGNIALGNAQLLFSTDKDPIKIEWKPAEQHSALLAHTEDEEEISTPRKKGIVRFCCLQ